MKDLLTKKNEKKLGTFEIGLAYGRPVEFSERLSSKYSYIVTEKGSYKIRFDYFKAVK